MSKLLTDVDTWETQVECPVSGDARSAASVEAGLQDLANRTKYLKNRKPVIHEVYDDSYSETYTGDTNWNSSTAVVMGIDPATVGDECVVMLTFAYKASGGASADAASYFRLRFAGASTTYSRVATVFCGTSAAAGTITIIHKYVVDDTSFGLSLQVKNHDTSMTTIIAGEMEYCVTRYPV